MRDTDEVVKSIRRKTELYERQNENTTNERRRFSMKKQVVIILVAILAVASVGGALAYKEELSSFDLSVDSPINLDHKIFMKYKKGKIYLTQVEFSLQKKENIIYKIDLPINLNKMIFITNLNIPYPKHYFLL